MWKTRRLRSCHRLVDYVLVAEFDIDTGSTLRHQYPTNIPHYKADWFAEHMLPEGAHNRDVDYTYIFLNRKAKHVDEDLWVRPKGYQSDRNGPSSVQDCEVVSLKNPALSSGGPPDESASKPFLYGLNLVKTRHDSSVRRGAIVIAMCIFSQYHFIEAFKEPLDLALDEYFDHRSVDVLKKIYNALNSLDLSSLPRPDYLECLMMRRGVKYLPIHCNSVVPHLPSSWLRSVSMNYRDKELKLTFPVFHTPDEVGDVSVTNLVKLFGESVMRIYHAVLTKQRILFVGYNHATKDIAQMVLSSVAMVAPPLTGIIRRTFPYANLADLNFLEVKGYIAGVTNPMFQQHEKWWDLLCVLDIPNFIGQVYSAEEKASEDKSSGVRNGGNSRNRIESGPEEMAHLAPDQKFIHTVLSGIQARLGEEWVRQQFLDYTSSIFINALDKGMFLNTVKLGDRAKRLIEANLPRMSQLDASSEFQQMPSNLWAWTLPASIADTSNENTEDGDGLVFKTYLRKIKYEAGLDSMPETEIFFQFFEKQLQSEGSIQALLVMMPESQGGIQPLAAGLFSAIPTVRLSTVKILLKISDYSSTKPVIDNLNPFLKSAYDRQIQRFLDGSLLKEAEEFKKKTVDSTKFSILETTSVENTLMPAGNLGEDASIVDAVMETLRSNSMEASHLVESLENIVSSTFQQTLMFIEEELKVNQDSNDTESQSVDTNDIVLLP